MYSGLCLCHPISLSLQSTLLMLRTSILTIYSDLSLPRYDVKIYVLLHLTQRICTVRSLSHSVPYLAQNIHVQTLKPDNIFEPFTCRYYVEFCVPKQLTRTNIWGSLYPSLIQRTIFV